MTIKVQAPADGFRDFTLDPALIEQLVHRQNGTISTAIRELITNSIDAGATDIYIELTDTGFRLRDNGHGFQSKGDVERFFGRFGTPHHEGDARYGRFRIGRAQIMAFGAIVWSSGVHRMSTDIRQHGYGYAYTEIEEPVTGCTVDGTFYRDKWHHASLIESDLVVYLAYCETKVFLNGKLISRTEEEKASLKPSYEDEFIAIYKPSKGKKSLRLYSDGIFVKELNFSKYGISADCVSKKALELNTARNDVATSCPHWRSIHGALLAELNRSRRSGEGWTPEEKEAALYQIVDGELDLAEVFEVPLIKDVRGKYYSFKQLLITPKPLVAVPTGQELAGDLMASSNIAYAIKQSDLYSWGVSSTSHLCELMIAHADHSPALRPWRRRFYSLETRSFECLLEGIDTNARIILQKDLTELEKVQRASLQAAGNRMAKLLGEPGKYTIIKRKVAIGECSSAQAWTDGSTYIAFARPALKAFDAGMSGLAYLSAVLLHEYTHDDPSLSAVSHDFEFYESFHNSVFGKKFKNLVAECQETLRVTYERLLGESRLEFPAWLANQTGQQPIRVVLRDDLPSPDLIRWLKFADVPYRRRDDVLIIGYYHRNLFHNFCQKLEDAAERENIDGVLTNIESLAKCLTALGLALPSKDMKIIFDGIQEVDRTEMQFVSEMGRIHDHLGDIGWFVNISSFGIQRVERFHTMQVTSLATPLRYSSHQQLPWWSKWDYVDRERHADPADETVARVRREIRDLLATVSPEIRARLLEEGLGLPEGSMQKDGMA